MSKPSYLVQGTLDLLILKILALASGDVLQVSDGSLYPALHKLEAGGLDHSRVEAQREQPPREVLFADPDRRKALEKESANWERLSNAISHVVGLDEA